ncbi:hypothetical protein [Mycolicibacterium austroafricanum]|uniref:hypothetical protein n=1 Tax=Mycolicibacterium austroafricanum TaxID=39687 RepID=UPI0005628AB9|nr:hypothetical protein [Mycolicibacterium austroafricanum]
MNGVEQATPLPTGTVEATSAEANHHRGDVWIAAGCTYPVGTVWWLYETGTWSGGFVRSIDRAVSRDVALRVPAIGVERV